MNEAHKDDRAKTVDWYFDLVSPFAYLQLQVFDLLPADLKIVPKPVLLGAILKHWGPARPGRDRAQAAAHLPHGAMARVGARDSLPDA